MKKFIEEFKSFALRGNMMDMAVGVIIGGGFTGIVTSLTDNFINPILNFVTGAETYTLQNIAGFASKFVSDLVNFLILAFVLFCLLKAINKIMSLGQKKEEPLCADCEEVSVLLQRDSARGDPVPALYFCSGRKGSSGIFRINSFGVMPYFFLNSL